MLYSGAKGTRTPKDNDHVSLRPPPSQVLPGAPWYKTRASATPPSNREHLNNDHLNPCGRAR
jgi:hypothetical protein